MKTDIYTKDLSESLENYVDQFSLEAILNALSEICALKAQHLQEYWQDEELAKPWLRDSRKLDKLAEKLEN